jgi:hypothetical protein
MSSPYGEPGAGVLKGAQMKSGFHLGLPTEKIDRLTNAGADELQAAFDYLLGWLVREGWIRS